MIVKTFLLSALLVFSLTAGDIINDVVVDEVQDISVEAISDNARNRRASEGDITGHKRIIVDDENLPGDVQPDGSKCVKKLVYVNETEFERGMDCHHKLKEKCHLTYVTDYHPAAEKKCETTFKKNCHITFKSVPHTETVKVCHTPYEKKCGDEISGPTVCKDHYETICETRYKEYDIEEDHPECQTVEELRCNNKTISLLHLPEQNDGKEFAVKERCEKWPVQKCDLKKKNTKKIHPDTECKKVPKKVCAPSNCQVVPGEEICNDETKTQIQRIPEEECDLQPREDCRTESSLVPKLVPKKNCVKVPKEVCVNTKKNPKTVTKPIVKNWCYKPNELKDSASE